MPKIQVKMDRWEREVKKHKIMPPKRKSLHKDTDKNNGKIQTWEIEKEETQESLGNKPSTDLPVRKITLSRDFKVEVDADPQSSQIDLGFHKRSSTTIAQSADSLLPTSTRKKAAQKLCVKIKEEPETTDFDHCFSFENDTYGELANQALICAKLGKQSHDKLEDEASKDMKTEIAADIKHENQITDENMESHKHDNIENTSVDPDFAGSGESDSELPVHFQEKEQSEAGGNFYKCGTCHLAFSESAELRQHALEHETDQRLYGCGLCRRVFMHFPLLTQHVLFIHARTGNLQPVKDRPVKSRSYICDVCNKVFHRACDLSRHKKIHSDNKPFVCDVCSKVFCRMDNMNRHRKIHSGDRPFKCEECHKIFLTVGDLNQHRKVHSENQPFVCEVCSKGFIRFDKFDRHRKMHSGIRPFECDECGKTFITITDLLTHKKYHSGYKPFICDVCPKAFYRMNDLNRHKTIHITNKRAKRKALITKGRKQCESEKVVTKCENRKASTQDESKESVSDAELECLELDKEAI